MLNQPANAVAEARGAAQPGHAGVAGEMLRLLRPSQWPPSSRHSNELRPSAMFGSTTAPLDTRSVTHIALRCPMEAIVSSSPAIAVLPLPARLGSRSPTQL